MLRGRIGNTHARCPRHSGPRADRDRAGPVHARQHPARELEPGHPGRAHPDVPDLPVHVRRRAAARSGGFLRRFRQRGAGGRLRPHDRGQGSGDHRRAAAAGERDRRGLEGPPDDCAVAHPGGRRGAERLPEQHSHRRAAAAHPGGGFAALEGAGVRGADAYGIRHHPRRHVHDHRHLDQPAGGRHRGRSGPGTSGHVRLRPAGGHRRRRRHPVPLARGAAARAGARAAARGYSAPSCTSTRTASPPASRSRRCWRAPAGACGSTASGAANPCSSPSCPR